MVICSPHLLPPSNTSDLPYSIKSTSATPRAPRTSVPGLCGPV
jgi:hypothetical protein